MNDLKQYAECKLPRFYYGYWVIKKYRERHIYIERENKIFFLK
jgi:hypothetical protein